MLPLAIALAILTGSVVDTAGKPVRGAHVYVYGAFPKLGVSSVCPNCYRDCGKHEAVDAGGAFRVKAVDEKLYFDVLAVADGYEPAFARRADPVGAPLRIELARRVRRGVSGVVLDPKGQPVLGATVAPLGDVPPSITNAKGEFALSAQSMLDVRVTARALAPHLERGLTAGERRTIRLIEGTAITGHVERDGQPVAGARVAFVSPNQPRAEIATNDSGFFMMTSLAPNEAYAVSTPDLPAEEKVVTTGADGSTADAGTLRVSAQR